MMAQLGMVASLTPQQKQVLSMLREADGAWVSGITFVNAHVLAYSQRIGQLRKLGFDIESTGRGGVASYRLDRR